MLPDNKIKITDEEQRERLKALYQKILDRRKSMSDEEWKQQLSQLPQVLDMLPLNPNEQMQCPEDSE